MTEPENVCQYCGCPIPRKNKYCSTQCANAVNNRNRHKVIYKHTCGSCGKQFETDNPKSKYCSHRCHGDSKIKKILFERKCVICGKAFTIYDNPDLNTTSTCSNKCRGRVISQKRKGVPIPNGRKLPDSEERTCVICGRAFLIDPRKSIRITCSRKCNSKYRSQNTKRPPQDQICCICGKIFHSYRARKKTCSGECRSQLSSQNMKDHLEKHPRPKTGKGRMCRGPLCNYGPDWDKIAKQIRRRDRHTCQVCGLWHKGSVGISALDVHHIIPLRTFGGDYNHANHPDNLITLCSVCHSKVENSFVLLPDTIIEAAQAAYSIYNPSGNHS